MYIVYKIKQKSDWVAHGKFIISLRNIFEICFSKHNARCDQFVIQVAPRQGGAYWAPELGNGNVLIWSFSEGFNAEATVTCVGIATSTGSLNDMTTWTDAGQPMFCIDQKDYEEERSSIDPSVFTGFDGK